MRYFCNYFSNTLTYPTINSFITIFKSSKQSNSMSCPPLLFAYLIRLCVSLWWHNHAGRKTVPANAIHSSITSNWTGLDYTVLSKQRWKASFNGPPDSLDHVIHLSMEASCSQEYKINGCLLAIVTELIAVSLIFRMSPFYSRLICVHLTAPPVQFVPLNWMKQIWENLSSSYLHLCLSNAQNGRFSTFCILCQQMCSRV